MSPFKTNYKYALRTLLSPRQAKKSNKIGKKRAEKLMVLHKELCESAKMVQERMKLYYNRKKSEGPDLKKGDKVWLLHKNFKSQQPSKKLDYIKLGPFRIIARILNLTYKLDLPAKMKIYPVQHIAMLESAHRNIKPPVYKIEIYRGQEEDKWDI